MPNDSRKTFGTMCRPRKDHAPTHIYAFYFNFFSGEKFLLSHFSDSREFSTKMQAPSERKAASLEVLSKGYNKVWSRKENAWQWA